VPNNFSGKFQMLVDINLGPFEKKVEDVSYSLKAERTGEKWQWYVVEANQPKTCSNQP
jgi:hypothetical protein